MTTKELLEYLAEEVQSKHERGFAPATSSLKSTCEVYQPTSGLNRTTDLDWQSQASDGIEKSIFSDINNLLQSVISLFH